MIAVFDWVLMDPNTQINGIVAIEDMTGFNIRHSMALYTTENTKKFLAIYQVCLWAIFYQELISSVCVCACVRACMRECERVRVYSIT